MSDDTPTEEERHLQEQKLKKQLIAGSVLLTVLSLVAVYIWIRPQWYQNYAPTQPIPFSHQIHAGQYKIPCLYCHGSAEYAAHAEVPGLELCMNCHSQVKVDSPWIKQVTEAYKKNEPLKWVKVHVLPDFVHFKHRPHIAAGVDCAVCHGPVQTMSKVYQWAPMTMGWCIDCHRNNNYLTVSRIQLSDATSRLSGKKRTPLDDLLGHPDPHNASVDCSTCHY